VVAISPSIENERPALNNIGYLLENTSYVPKLVGPHGEEIELPQSLFIMLRQIVHYLLNGRAVTIVPLNKELTTQEAADILNVSRPYLIKLLEQEMIPYTKIGTHRRIRFTDLLEYKKRHDEELQRGLEEITRLSEEMGLYD
jgi:excisionase family DNA binding protein